MKTIILLATLLFQVNTFASMASNTLVAFQPGQVKPINEFTIGDPVAAGSYDKQLTFRLLPVKFSDGVQFGSNVMLYLKTAGTELIVTTDMLLMKADGTLQRAAKLVPGDLLMKEDGSPETLLSIVMGRYEGGVHHISTSASPATSVNDHLIIVNGLIGGDYSLQLGLQ